jgi:hypothetical protein
MSDDGDRQNEPPASSADTEDDQVAIGEDPETGSTVADPSAEDSGLPPGGEDPMAGEALSG